MHEAWEIDRGAAAPRLRVEDGLDVAAMRQGRRGRTIGILHTPDNNTSDIGRGTGMLKAFPLGDVE